MGGKGRGRNVPRNPLYNLNIWPVLTVFICLILSMKKIKDRRTPTHLGNSYYVALAGGPQLHALAPSCLWSFEETRNQRL